MDDFTQRLRGEGFPVADAFDTARAYTQREEITHMYEEKMRIVLHYSWVHLLLGILLMGGGIIWLSLSMDIRGMIIGAMLFLTGVSVTVLIKLWYWIMNDKWSVIREIKELQIQVAELSSPKQNNNNQ